jgi:hypothetical protein
MDGTRIADLDRLTMVIHNPDESVAHKRQAARALGRIKRQMHDPKLKALRERLIRATQANDTYWVEKLSDELHDYQFRTYGQ